MKQLKISVFILALTFSAHSLSSWRVRMASKAAAALGVCGSMAVSYVATSREREECQGDTLILGLDRSDTWFEKRSIAGYRSLAATIPELEIYAAFLNEKTPGSYSEHILGAIDEADKIGIQL